MTNLISRIALSAILLQSVVAADPLQEQGQPYAWDCPGSGYLPYRRDLLVSTEELAQGMESSEVTIIHVGFAASGPGAIRRVQYSEAHLPGARHLTWSDLQGRGETLSPAESRWPALAALGISRGRRVVLYDTGLGLEAAAAFVALESLGLADHAALLDGQWAKWASEGRPLCRWGEEGIPSEDLEPRPSNVALSRDEMAPFLLEAGQPRPVVALVDARAGSLASAPRPFLKLPWTENLVSLSLPVFKSEAELRRRWAFVAPRPDLRVVVAARNWREAAPVYFVARLLGYSVQLFDGSIEDLGESVLTLEREP
jgi:3-mercaptopyruvate sulfurtransferase SseA